MLERQNETTLDFFRVIVKKVLWLNNIDRSILGGWPYQVFDLLYSY